MDYEIKLKSQKTIRGRRFIKKKCPLLNENDKNALLITNGRGLVNKQFMTDMKLLKKPLALSHELNEKISLFDDPSLLDKLFEKFNSSLFIMCSHSKKCKSSITFGRTFDNHILDMYEFELVNYTSMFENKLDKFNFGSKPIVIFQNFPNSNENMIKFYLKTLLLDMFRGPKVVNINRSGLDYCIQFQSLNETTILMSVCKVKTIFENNHRTVTEVIDIGAQGTLNLRRHQLPDPDLWKKALKKPMAAKPKKQKNIEKDIFGNVFGRVHVEREDNDKLVELSAQKYRQRTRKLKTKEDNEPMEIVE